MVALFEENKFENAQFAQETIEKVPFSPQIGLKMVFQVAF
jgi:hypothetical protein